MRLRRRLSFDEDPDNYHRHQADASGNNVTNHLSSALSNLQYPGIGRSLHR